MDKLGKIEWAKEHSSANKPMNKIKEFTESTKFCRCCNLPIKTPGIIEPFSFCENIENFSVCGKAVSLYFYFYLYCISILVMVFITMSLPITIFNYSHLSNIEGYCTYLKNNNFSSFNKEININDICDKYLENNNGYIKVFFDLFWKVSTDNIFDYIKLLEYNIELNGKKKDNIKVYELFNNYSLIGFICMVSIFIINICIIILFKAKIKADKIDNIQLSDYTLLITDLKSIIKEFREQNDNIELPIFNPSCENDLIMIDYEYDNKDIKTHIEEFTKFLNDNFFKYYNIYNINLCYKLNEFMEIQKKYEKCKYKIFQILNNPYQIKKNKKNNYSANNRRYYTSPFTLMHLNCLCCSNKGMSLENLYKRQNKYENKLNLLVNKTKLNNFCGCIFVTFNTIKEKERFYNNYPHFFIEYIIFYIKNMRHILFCCIRNKRDSLKFHSRKKIGVYSAPEPEDVIWENLEFTVSQRFFRVFFIYLIAIIFIVIVFHIVYLLNIIKIEVKEGNFVQLLKYVVSFSISIIVFIINKILKIIMGLITKKEKQYSMTNYRLSFSIKLTIFTFVVSAIVPLLSHFINPQYEKHNNNKLITTILFIFLINSFLNPLFWTVNVGLIVKKIRIYFIERKENPNSKHFKTQKELNDLYQYPDMGVSAKYSYIFKTVLMSMFYLPIFPLGILISLLGLIFAFFLEKYNFTHIYKRPEMLNEKIGEFYFDFFIFVLLSYSIGNYIFLQGLFKNDSWAIVNIIFFGILTIIPYTKPISYHFNWSNDFDIDLNPINDIYFSFYNDYQRQNPFTKKEGLNFYVNELKNRGYISKFVYDILIKNIEKINVMEIYYNTSMAPTLRKAQYTLSRVKTAFSVYNFSKKILKKLRKGVIKLFKQNQKTLKIK